MFLRRLFDSFSLFLAAVGFLSVSRVVDFYEFDIFELSCEAT